MHKFICGLLFSVFFFSCDSNLQYETFQKVDVAAWNYQEKLHFTIPVKESGRASVTIAIRNTADYEKANLWLFLYFTSPSGKILQDTVNCPLADDYGYWLGSGFSGLYLTEHTLENRNYCEEQGDWQLTITQGMRQDDIKGISEVGVLVRKIEE